MKRNPLAMGAGALAVAALARGATKRIHRFALEGKVVLISGGSRGLGLALAREFASRGAHLALLARKEHELARVESELSREGIPVLTVPCDISNRRDVEDGVQRVMAELGPVDVLVNCAGVIQVGPFEETTLEDFEEAMGVHFWGPLYLTWAVTPSMRERKSGRIVNISSIGGKVSVPHLLPYSASKFALTGLSEGLRAELFKDGIRVTTVCPSLMRTGSPRNATFKGQHRAEYAWFSVADSLPLLSMSAPRAAKKIVDACERGEAELILSPQGKLMAGANGIFAGLVSDLLAFVNRLLPGPGGIGRARALGHASESKVSRSPLTALSRRAEAAHNQL